MFRENGFEGVGVDVVTNGAGLTHGGFYCHFGSKDDLAAEAVVRALQRGLEQQSHYRSQRDLVFASQHFQHRLRSRSA